MSDLWGGGVEIDVLGVTGEYQSGKTLFLLTVDPRNTLLFDFEKSAGTYAGLEIKKRVDVPTEMLKLKKGEYKPVDVFVWWKEELQKIKPGEYSVIAVDPISDIEAGLVDWVKANPAYFGKTAVQYEKASGLLWGDVKAYWKVILSDLASRCATFGYATHMRDIWSGNTNTGRRQPKGKDTLMELSSLYLQLERLPVIDTDGKASVRPEPSAVILKSRLAHTKIDATGKIDIIPILPPRLPKATPSAIRAYIAKPPDYSKLKKGEMVEAKVLSEDQKLTAQREIAENQRLTEEAKLSQLELAANAAAKQAAMRKRVTVTMENTVVGTAAAEPAKESPAVSEVTPAPQNGHPVESPIDPLITDVYDTILRQKASLGMPDDKFHAALEKRGVIAPHTYLLPEAVRKLSPDNAENLRKALWDVLTKRQMMTDTAKSAAEGKS